MPRVAALAVALLLAGCQGAPAVPAAKPSAGGPTSAAPTASAPNGPGSISTLEPTPTAEPTVHTTLAPEPEAKVEITQVFFKAWVDGIDSVEFELVVEVKNNGTGPADISTGSNDYTIYDKSEAVLETGSFTYAVPQILEAGQTGYFIDAGFMDDEVRLKDVGEADPDIHYLDTTDSQALFEVSKVRVTAESYGPGLQVSGVVKNTSSEAATDPFVAVIFFNSSDRIIGALYENSLGQIDAGAQKGFKTSYPGTPPLKASAVAGFKAIAFQFTFFF